MSLTATESTQPTRAELYKKVNRRLVPFLLICYTFAYLDRVNIGYAKLHMQEDIPALTEAVFGIGAGIFFLAYALLEVPSNLLMHRIGARRTITRIMVLWGLTSSAMMFVNNEITFYILRVLLGIFEAGFAPGIILYLTYWFPAKRMAAVMGLYMLAGPIGSIFGSAGSALLIDALDGAAGLSGWQWMFPIQGLPCVLLGIIFWKMMKDHPKDVNWLTDKEKQLLNEDLDQTTDGQHTSDFLQALKHPTVYVMSIAYFGIMCGIYAASFWLPTILRDNGITDNLTNGLVSSIPYAITIPVMILLTRSSDRHGERTWHAIVPAAIASIGLVVAAFTSTTFLVSFIALCCAVAGVWGAYTVFWAVPSQHFGGKAAAGSIAFINTWGILGGFVAPMVMGFFRDLTGSTQGGLLSMVALIFCSIIALLILPARIRADREDAHAH